MTFELAGEILDIFNERIVAADIAPDEFYKGGSASLTTFLDRLPLSLIRRAIVTPAQIAKGSSAPTTSEMSLSVPT